MYTSCVGACARVCVHACVRASASQSPHSRPRAHLPTHSPDVWPSEPPQAAAAVLVLVVGEPARAQDVLSELPQLGLRACVCRQRVGAESPGNGNKVLAGDSLGGHLPTARRVQLRERRLVRVPGDGQKSLAEEVHALLEPGAKRALRSGACGGGTRVPLTAAAQHLARCLQTAHNAGEGEHGGGGRRRTCGEYVCMATSLNFFSVSLSLHAARLLLWVSQHLSVVMKVRM